jgi:aminoglycoside phosphotransferase (APT) family kinase protein
LVSGLLAEQCVLTLDDGTVIEIAEQPAQGTRHAVFIGREHRSRDCVVVKVELIPDVLATERVALEWVGAHGGPVPGVRTISTIGLPDGRRAACLVMDHVNGRVPDSNESWRRMGRTLAALTKLPSTGSALATYDPTSFGDAHQQRLHDLGAPLREAVLGIPDWNQLSSRYPPAPGPLVITHGDPGPGNFLDDGHTGTLIDWEEAQVAPRGLDLGRAIFIALLGSGPSGFVARDRHARARSVASGYLTNIQHTWAPGPTELRWWLTAAGVQFAHRRRQRAGQPGVLPWTDAISILASALRYEAPSMPG